MQKEMIAVVGPSGTGKSWSVSGLADVAERVFVLDSEGKGLPFQGGRRFHCEEPEPFRLDRDKKSNNPPLELLKRVEESKDFDYLIVESFTRIMDGWEFWLREIMRGEGNKYARWDEYVAQVWNFFNACKAVRRSGKHVVLVCHEDVGGRGERRIGVRGQFWRGRIEEFLNVVLWAEVVVEKDSAPDYHFVTQSDGWTSAKSPAGMFNREEPNDLRAIFKKVDAYYGASEQESES